MFKINTAYKLVAVSLFVLAFSFVFSTSAHAATINVTTDDVFPAVDGDGCTLREAIENVNNQPATPHTDCTTADGNNDTIIIPAGTLTLAADLPQINNATIIQGAGMRETIVDGDGEHIGIAFNGSNGNEQFAISRLTVTGFSIAGLGSLAGSTTIDQVEVDGTNAEADVVTAGIMIQNSSSESGTFRITNSYVHSIDSGGQGAATTAGIFIVSNSSASNIATVENVTISGVASDASVNGVVVGGGIFGPGVGLMEAVLRNITVSDITSTTSPAGGVNVNPQGNGQISNVFLQNSTIKNIAGVDPGIGLSGVGIGVVTIVSGPDDTAEGNLMVTNTIVDSQCFAADISQLVVGPGAGEGIATLTSGGGNLSSDSSCASFFTHPTDQNNLTNLASTLGPLQDNGGFAPTMALLQGSPAIDSGVTVVGLTTDARGEIRPQGTAFDSGAYESPFSKPATASLADTGQSATLYALTGLTILTLATGAIAFTRRTNN